MAKKFTNIYQKANMHLYIHPSKFKRSKSTSQVNFYSDSYVIVSLLTLKQENKP